MQDIENKTFLYLDVANSAFAEMVRLERCGGVCAGEGERSP